MKKYQIRNMSRNTYAFNYKYVVVNNLDGELWFYGATNDLRKVSEMIREGAHNGEVYEIDEIEMYD